MSCFQVSVDLGVLFPETWTPMKDGEFLELVKVDPNSKEYNAVVTDFNAKLGNNKASYFGFSVPNSIQVS